MSLQLGPIVAGIVQAIDRHRAIRFLIVGCSNTLVSFFSYLVALVLLPPTAWMSSLAQVISYGIGILWSYILNRHWVFRSREPALGEGSRFLVLQLSLMLTSAAAIGFAVDRLDINKVIAWVLVMTIITLINFVLMRSWAFQKQ